MEKETQKIRIRCPQHQTVFKAEHKPHLVCEIRDHTLSSNFPNGEFWEYCCDCQTYLPSEFGAGGTAKEKCINCERKIIQRYVCDNCKITSFDSAEDTKGKTYKISLQKGVEPICPGCRRHNSSKPFQHDCSDVGTVILTTRSDCPFCQKSTVQKPNKLQKTPETAQYATSELNASQAKTACPNCGDIGNPERGFCTKCGHRFENSGEEITLGTQVPKTILLGSICPSCGTANDRDAVFCVNCGQKFKDAANINTVSVTPQTYSNVNQQNTPPVLPLPPPPMIPGQAISGNPKTKPSAGRTGNKNLQIIGGLIGGVVLLIIIIAGINASNKNSGISNTNSDVNYENSSDFQKNDSPYAGKKGISTTDVVIRDSPSPYAGQVAVFFEDSEMEILNSGKSETGTLWYKVRIVKYGCSRVNGRCGKDNDYDSTEGWVYSNNVNLQ